MNPVVPTVYATLLQLALADSARTSGSPTTGPAIAEVQRFWPRSRSSDSHVPVAAAIADQVAYDVSLIRLSACFGILVKPEEFSHPERRRREVERLLRTRGVALPG